MERTDTCFCGRMICAEAELLVLGMGWLSMHAALTTCTDTQTIVQNSARPCRQPRNIYTVQV